MKITCIRNFLANGVAGSPGKILSQEECDSINPLMDELKKEKLILVEEGQPAAEAPGSSGMIDDGPDAQDDLPDAPEDAKAIGEAIEDKPKAKPNKKK